MVVVISTLYFFFSPTFFPVLVVVSSTSDGFSETLWSLLVAWEPSIVYLERTERIRNLLGVLVPDSRSISEMIEHTGTSEDVFPIGGVRLNL